MQRKMVIILFCLLGCLGRPVVANCLVIEQIDKLYILQARMMDNPATGLFATDMRQLRIISANLSDGVVLDAIGGNRIVGQGARFVRFKADTRRLTQSVSLDDPQSVRPHFTAERRARIIAIGNDLTALRCTRAEILGAETEATASAAANNGAATTDAEDMRAVTDTLNRAAQEVLQLRSLVILLTIGLVIAVLTPLIRNYLVFRKRRTKRYTTTFSTRYQLDATEREGTLLDINCFGTKMRHDAQKPPGLGSDVTIRIDASWAVGTIVWCNEHYSGVLFKPAISLEEVAFVRLSN